MSQRKTTAKAMAEGIDPSAIETEIMLNTGVEIVYKNTKEEYFSELSLALSSEGGDMGKITTITRQ